MPRAEGEGAHRGESLQGPVEQQGVEVRRGLGGGGGPLLGAVGHLAAFLVEFRDALGEEVEEGGYGDGPRGELEQGEDLGDGLDGFGDRGGLDALG